MKNVTIALDDEIHRQARVYAAEQGTSLSALVKEYLSELVNEDPQYKGVREMHMPYIAEPAYIGGTHVLSQAQIFTKNGKSRKPGALRGMLDGADAANDEWPDGFLDALHGDDTEAAKTWWK